MPRMELSRLETAIVTGMPMNDHLWIGLLSAYSPILRPTFTTEPQIGLQISYWQAHSY